MHSVKNDNLDALFARLEQTKEEQNNKVEQENKAAERGFLNKLKFHISRITNFAKESLLNVQAAFNSFKKTNPNEYARINTMIHRIVGQNTSPVNNRAGMRYNAYSDGGLAGISNATNLSAVDVTKMSNDELYKLYSEKVNNDRELQKHMQSMRTEGKPLLSEFEANRLKRDNEAIGKLLEGELGKRTDSFGVNIITKQHFKDSSLYKRYLKVKDVDGSREVMLDLRGILKDVDFTNNKREKLPILAAVLVDELRSNVNMKHKLTKGLAYFGQASLGFGLLPIVDAQVGETKYSESDVITLLSFLVDADYRFVLSSTIGDTRRKDIASEMDFLKKEIHLFLMSGYIGLPTKNRANAVLAEFAKQEKGDMSTGSDTSDAAALDVFNYVKKAKEFLQQKIKDAQEAGVLVEKADYYSLPIKKSSATLAMANDTDAVAAELDKMIEDRIRSAADPNTGDVRYETLTLVNAGLLPIPDIHTGLLSTADMIGLDTDNANVRKIIDEYARFRLDKDVGKGRLQDRTISEQKEFAKALNNFIESTMFANGVDGAKLKLTNDQTINYHQAMTRAFDPVVASNLEKRNPHNVDTTVAVATFNQIKDGIHSPVSMRRMFFDQEMSKRALFVQKGRVFDPDIHTLMDMSLDQDSALFGVFETSMESLADGLHKGRLADAATTEVVSSLIPVMNTPIKDILNLIAEAGTLANTDQTEKDAIANGTRILGEKASASMGRRAFVDSQLSSQLNKMAVNGLASGVRNLTLMKYGPSLGLATLTFEGTMAALEGTLTMGRLLTVPKLFGNVMMETIRTIGREGSLGYKSYGKDMSSFVVYGLRHAQLRAREEGGYQLTSDSAVSSAVSKALQYGKKVGDVAVGLSTVGGAASLNGLRLTMEGVALKTLQSMRKDGMLQKVFDAMGDDDIQYALRNAKTSREQLRVVDMILKRANFRGSRLASVFAKGSQRRLLHNVIKSGLHQPSFNQDLNDLIQLSSEKHEFTVGEKGVVTDTLNINAMYEAAMKIKNPDKRKRYLDTLRSLGTFVNMTIETALVTSNALDNDTKNDPMSVLFKIYRSYPAAFFAQRIAKDFEYMTPHEKFTRFMLYMALDMAYMTANEMLKSGMWEWSKEQREKYFEQLNANKGEYFFRKALRTASMLGNQQPIIDLVGGMLLDFNNNRLSYNTQATRGLLSPFAAENATKAGGSFFSMITEGANQILNGEGDTLENTFRALEEYAPVVNGVIGKAVLNEIHAYINPESQQEAVTRKYEKAMRSLNRLTTKKDNDAETIQEILESEHERGLSGEFYHPSLLTPWGYMHHPETEPDTSNETGPRFEPIQPTPSTIPRTNPQPNSPMNAAEILEKVRERDPVSDILDKNKKPTQAPDLRP